MNQFKYTLKIKEAKEATTKKKRKELFNEAADHLPWWGKDVSAEQTLWFKIATYLLLHHKEIVYMQQRAKRISHYAGKISTAYGQGSINKNIFQDAFKFTKPMTSNQSSSLAYTLRMDDIPHEVKFSLGKLLGELYE